MRLDSAKQHEQQHSPWLAVVGVVGVYFAFGFALGVMAPLVDEISDDLDLSRSTMGSILGAWALIYVFTAVPAGAVVDRLGLRWSLTLGGLSIAVSLLLRSAATGALGLFVAVAVFGVGGPLVSIATPKLVASLFDEDERRLPTGLGVSAPALGSAVALALTNPVLLPAFDNNWRMVLVLSAAIAVAATAGWLIASRAVSHLAVESELIKMSTLRRLLCLASMRQILALSVCSFFISHALNSWLPEILSGSGQSDNAAGYLSAISVTCGIAGALTIARLVPSHRRQVALTAIFGIIAVCLVGITQLPLGPLLVALGALGFVRAGIIPMLFLLIMGDPDISLSDIGAATGLFFAFGEIGGFSGPYVVGAIADRTDGFGATVVTLAVIAVASAMIAGLRPQTPASRRRTL